MWTEGILKKIGDALGEYLSTDMTFLNSRIMTMEKILVDIDLRDRFLDSMTISKGKYKH